MSAHIAKLRHRGRAVLVLGFAFSLAGLLCTAAPSEDRFAGIAGPERFADAYADAIQALLRDNFAGGSAGMAIGLLDEHGSRVFSAGKLDNGTGLEVGAETIFELGSVTKVFTSLLVLDAVRRGEMQLDDPVAKYLPKRVNVPARGGKEITLLHLAAQESGLPWHPDNLSDRAVSELSLKELKAASESYTVEDMYAFLSGYKLT